MMMNPVVEEVEREVERALPAAKSHRRTQAMVCLELHKA